ncbi:MAG: gliding motility-associated C-terminal domain-containing protein [Sediminibacterium sp.]|nr:gliding motility-associated C-terminal domain-containing protein [Sediminibacterium sp.]
MKNIITVLALLLFPYISLAQGSCQTAAPFCTGTTYNFPATVNGPPAQAGPDYDCLFTQPNPAWYYLQIATPGPLTLTIQGQINGGPGQDVDFVCWGPFPNLTNICNNLTATNVVDCSYSGSFTETLTIPNAQVGQFYMVCITNFANVAQNIVFNQPVVGPGDGTTNCAILCQATAANSGSVCTGGNVTLTANTNTAVTSFTWNGPGGFTSTLPNPVITPTASGTYSLIATTSQGTCMATTNVTVASLATPTITNVGATCQGMSFNLNVSGGPPNQYNWTGPNGFTSNQQNIQFNNAVPSQSGGYTVTVTSGLCTQTAAIVVSVTPMPTVTAQNTGPYCPGQNIILSANGASSYTWAGPGNFTSNAPIVSIPASGTSGGLYTLVGANGTCTNAASSNVVVYPAPVITISNNSPVCENFPLQLNASGGNTYSWVGPGNYNTLNQNPFFAQAPLSANGVFTVIVTSVEGCTASAVTSVSVNAKPNPTILIPNVCLGTDMFLTATGGGTYSWTGPNGFSSTLANPVITNVTNAAAGSYSVTITAPGGCTATASAPVQVYPLPEVKILGTNSLCPGGVFSFLGQGANFYKWLIPPGVLSTANTYTISTNDPLLQPTYTLQGSDNNGCINYAVIHPFVLPRPYGVITTTNSGACAPLCTSFKLTTNAPLTSNFWSLAGLSTYNNKDSVTQCFLNQGVYPITVRMVNQYGCENTATTSVESYPIPVANFSNDPDKPTITEAMANFYDNTANANIVNWFWDFTNIGQDTSSTKNPSFRFPEIGEYLTTLIVTSDHGCMDSITKKITVTDDFSIYIPNAFTPNGDGQNDVFGAKGTGIKKYQLSIFDRWGELIFTSNDLLKGWDGTVKGNRIAQDGVYIWKVNAVSIFGSSKEYKGTVTLMR